MISSRSNPLVQQFYKLKKSLPGPGKIAFIEGFRLISEALNSAVSIQAFFYTPHAANLPQAKNLLELLVKQGAPTHLVSDGVMKGLSFETTPPGLLAVISGEPVPFASAGKQRVLALCGLQDPGNAGTLLRVAEGVGCAVWFSETSVYPWHPKVVKASMGSIFRVPCGRGPITSLFEILRHENRRLIGTKPRGGVPYDKIAWGKPFALFLGNEGAGLPPAVESQLDEYISIPLEAAVESLNVAVAAAVILFESKRGTSTGAPPL